jgi:hypothetical protein
MQISHDFVFHQAIIPLMLYEEQKCLSCDSDIAVLFHTADKSKQYKWEWWKKQG